VKESLRDKLTLKKWTLLTIAVLVPAGLYTKWYQGPGEAWVNNSLGGLLYVVFWSLFFSLLVRDKQPWKIPGWVTIVTCLVEVIQLWHPGWLEKVRATFLGATLLGNSFSWLDFPHYAAGFILSWLLLKVLP